MRVCALMMLFSIAHPTAESKPTKVMILVVLTKHAKMEGMVTYD